MRAGMWRAFGGTAWVCVTPQFAPAPFPPCVDLFPVLGGGPAADLPSLLPRRGRAAVVQAAARARDQRRRPVRPSFFSFFFLAVVPLCVQWTCVRPSTFSPFDCRAGRQKYVAVPLFLFVQIYFEVAYIALSLVACEPDSVGRSVLISSPSFVSVGAVWCCWM